MPELNKSAQAASPVARAGGGDISERELSRERYTLQTTPPARVQPAHPKKQLFSAPVNKFTAKTPVRSSNLVRLKSCIDQFARADVAPAKQAKIVPKALSMEDLTPIKRIRRERSDLPVLHSPGLRSSAEQEAGARIARFLLVQVWRRRRQEVKCLRKTLEVQVSSSERLRIQVLTLKSLLDSDNAKVRLAMRELERLKQLVHDKEAEKQVLEKEKLALENDVCAAEDRASEMSVGWRNCRNELECCLSSSAATARALAAERDAHLHCRVHRERLAEELSILEEEYSHQSSLLSSAQRELEGLRGERGERQADLDRAKDMLKAEQEAREHYSKECSTLSLRLSLAAEECQALREGGAALGGELARLRGELERVREQLDWWPRPLTRMLGAARSLFRYPMTVPEAVMWTLIPARHGC